MDFLLDALAEDLNRPVPSKEPAFLYMLNDRICLVRSLVKELECTKRLLTTIDRDFLGEDSATPLRGTELDRADALLRVSGNHLCTLPLIEGDNPGGMQRFCRRFSIEKCL
ncbi:MAG: hypothetical protein JMM75_01235 [Candidatus Xiphinematobacter sp.]|nr:MAG: hypothetical protein JMM75_01235 [Candidatus Xiphinematobacter sp.]